MFAIFSLNPHWGKDRLIETFDTKEDAEKVLQVLESVNINFNLYEVRKYVERKL